MLEAKGINGQITLDGNKISIHRKGLNALMTQGLKGDKDIYINQISSVQMKKAGLLTNGYIQFAFLGGQESKSGLMNAPRDENTVMFKSKQQKDFEAIKTEIERILIVGQPPSASTSGIDDLEKLAELRDKGIITAEDFEAKKKQILDL